MESINSCSFILKNIAFCRIQRDFKSDVFYIDSLFVKAPFRRKGIGTNLIMHACFTLGEWPELDIRSVSSVAERIATRLGYRLCSKSKRYKGCYLWRNELPFSCKESRFDQMKKLEHRGMKKSSLTVYLSSRVAVEGYNNQR